MHDDATERAETIRWRSTPTVRSGLTASCLCYLYADLFVPPLGRWSRRFGAAPGITVPSTDAVVSIGLLEVRLLGAALWDLRAQGHVAISWDEPLYRGSLRGKGREFSLRFTPHAVASPTTGIEAILLSALGETTCDLYALINDRWLRGGTLALNGIVVLAQREALARGLLYRLSSEGTPPRPLGWSKSPFRYVGDPAALDQFEEAAVQLAEDVVDLDCSTDREWKKLADESKRALYNSRPYFHFDGGAGGS